MELKVTDSTGQSYPVGSKVNQNNSELESSHTKYSFSLPSGDTYITKFVDATTGSSVWHVCAWLLWESKPTCAAPKSPITGASISLQSDTGDATSICKNIVPNGSLESLEMTH
eukprot:1271346-Ditylum_brightwellii.AAC.1